jgi:hypothetical protein
LYGHLQGPVTTAPTLHAAANESVIFGSLSAEEYQGGNASGLLLYSFILSWQDM